MSKTVAIIQARNANTRLPNKAMLWLNGYPIVEWVWRRVMRCKELDEVVVALPTNPKDDCVESFLLKQGATVYRGPEDNVLLRFTNVASCVKATNVVRICADNPLISWEEVDRLVRRWKQNNQCVYMYNHIPLGNCYPDGLGAEVVAGSFLDALSGSALSFSQREHVFNRIWDYQSQFDMVTFDPPDKRLHHPELRLDVDTYADYQRLIESGVEIGMDAVEVVEVMLK